MKKYACIHSHFYQPPRENPWLDKIELQHSAFPFHDWNERISNECYHENGRSRIIDGHNFVVDFSNNYSKMSFNIGPTLLQWMEQNDRKTYDFILEGDRLSVERFNGHGNALAQCYNHIIMPLASRRDKETQVIWGIRDFENRFRRYPEAMWLSETAVDTETLEVLAEHNMKYVILAPRQASRIRKIGSDNWIDVRGERVNPKVPYVAHLPSGKKIAIFFYDGGLSKAVAFDGLLHNGDVFGNRILGSFHDSHENQLVHMATDGESYGHHHKHGDMALAYALRRIESQHDVQLVNYGQYLEIQPPEWEVEIIENSSWSCVHGVERWRSNCGCNSGGHPHWHQEWRSPLRKTFDNLKDAINVYYESTMNKYDIDPWAVRNDYIDVIFNRNEISNIEFLNKWAPQVDNELEAITLMKCFEIQRQLLLMYTSCAWFFDEVSGLETVQNLQYALRAIELAEDIWGHQFKETFLKDLESVPSNIVEYGNGRGVFDKNVQGAQIDFFKIAVHYAVMSLFKEPAPQSSLYTFDIKKIDIERIQIGQNRVVCGLAEVRSRLTYSKKNILFTAFYLGENIISAGVGLANSQEEYRDFLAVIQKHLSEANLPEAMRELDKKYGKEIYTFKDLLAEDRNLLINDLLQEKMNRIENQYQQIYKENFTLVSFLSSLDIEIPTPLKISFEHIVNEKILSYFKRRIEDIDIKRFERHVIEIHNDYFYFKKEDIKKFLQQRLVDFAEEIENGKFDHSTLTTFHYLVNFVRKIVPDIQWSEIQYLIMKWKHKFHPIPLGYEDITTKIFTAVRIR